MHREACRESTQGCLPNRACRYPGHRHAGEGRSGVGASGGEECAAPHYLRSAEWFFPQSHSQAPLLSLPNEDPSAQLNLTLSGRFQNPNCSSTAQVDQEATSPKRKYREFRADREIQFAHARIPMLRVSQTCVRSPGNMSGAANRRKYDDTLDTRTRFKSFSMSFLYF